MRDWALPVARIVALAAFAGALAGCSIAIPIAPLYSAEDEVTGSIDKPEPLAAEIDAEDLPYADLALASALDPKGKGAAVAWAGTNSGAKGSFTPVAAAYRLADGSVCRAFIAEIETSTVRHALQGSACRPANGVWRVKDLRPWKAA